MATPKYTRGKRSYDSEMSEIGRRLGGMFDAQTVNNIALGRGTVQAVDEQAKTVDVLMDSNHAIRGISLDVVRNGDSGLLAFPAVGSTVVVGFIENRPELSFIISFTTIDKISLKTGGTVINLTDGAIEINGGSNGGLVLIDRLTAALNSFVQMFNAHVHTGNGAVAPQPPAPEFNSSDYENTNITQ